MFCTSIFAPPDMFLEPALRNPRSGWIEVICGCMFSGKTEELIRRIKRAQFANQNIIIFKPAKDVRYDEQDVVSHDSNSVKSVPLSKSEAILRHVTDEKVVGIDEAQFFDENLPKICEQLALTGYRVIIAGLDMDFKERSPIWANARFTRHCRICDQSTCHLPTLRSTSYTFISTKSRKRNSCIR